VTPGRAVRRDARTSPLLLGRGDNAWRHRDVVRADCPNVPSTYCDRFNVDSVIFDPGALALLTDTMGTARVMLGTDAPFPLGEQQPGALVETVFAGNASGREAILAGNARRVFALTC
jgi:aminocarboxymuconate-semialdehyde decarboxylase